MFLVVWFVAETLLGGFGMLVFGLAEGNPSRDLKVSAKGVIGSLRVKTETLESR